MSHKPRPSREQVITSAANTAVKAARKLTRRSGRARAGEAFLVEGPQALAEALPFLRRIFLAESAAGRPPAVVHAAGAAGVEVLVVADPVFALLATTVSSQGVVGVAALSEPSLDEVVGTASLLVVLHQVRDPGNAGTALRSADAAGADGVVLTRGSVDPRNPKAVRASAGSLFHLPVLDSVAFSAFADSCRRRGLRLVAADAGAAAVHSDVDLARPTAVVFGNEAAGLGSDVLGACDLAVRVPLHRGDRPGFGGAAESLNLAAAVAVVTFEAARQRRDATRVSPTL